VVYYLVNDGLVAIPFPIIVFLFFLIEETVSTIHIWKISFAYVTLLIMIKFLISLEGFEYIYDE